MNINTGGSNPLSLTFRDSNGNPVPAPAGTSVTWAVEDSVEGKRTGNVAADPENSLSAVIDTGDVGAEGVITVNVVFPDGSQIKGVSAPLTVVEPLPVSVDVNVATPAEKTTEIPAE